MNVMEVIHFLLNYSNIAVIRDTKINAIKQRNDLKCPKVIAANKD